MISYFAKFNAVTREIWTGSCGLDVWETQAGANEQVVQTAPGYMPDDLELGEDDVLRDKATGEPVALDPPLTRAFVLEQLAPLKDNPAALNEAMRRLDGAHSREQVRAICDKARI